MERVASSMSVPATLQRSFFSQKPLRRPAHSMADLASALEPHSQGGDLDLPSWSSSAISYKTRRVWKSFDTFFDL